MDDRSQTTDRSERLWSMVYGPWSGRYWHDFFYRNIVSDNRRHSLLKLCLFFISFLVIIGQSMLLFMYSMNLLKKRKLSSKVISIGGITLGGVGKTPVVELLVNMLIKKGKKVAVLSRGYRRVGESDIKLVSNGKEILCNVEKAGDEPYLLAKNLKSTVVFVGKNRYETGKIAEEKFNVDIVVLDDGFQHWRLHRDINIVVINASSPFGNGYVFPRGNLREPYKCLKRADCFIITKIDMIKDTEIIKKRLLDINSSAQVITTIHKPVCFKSIAGEEQLDIECIKGEKVIALSSLGDPVSFENTLEHVGAKIVEKLRYPDHYWYAKKDIDNIQARQKALNVKFIITTQKDAVRLQRLNIKNLEILVLRIEVGIISGIDRLKKLINAI
ncbi:MAG: tetraacyldisaccharide 4'-kinase [bacterium]|nr:tetraacyldisaccharide 4'-kinase [bacterium]